MKGRTFSADEIARLFKTQVIGEDLAFDLGNGIKAVQMAAQSGLVFNIERDGKTHLLKDADAAELAEISGILWDRFGADFISLSEALADALTPDALKDKPDDNPLVPDSLKDEPEDGDPLTPDSLRGE